MRVAVFSTKPYDRRFLEAAARDRSIEFHYFEPRLNQDTAALAEGCTAVCVFVNDVLDETALEALADRGVRFIALRCAGYNNVDLKAAGRLGFSIARVPAYSPHAVAEHTLALILTLNRKIHKAYNRVREGNFAIEGLLGFDLNGKTAGVVGTGRIGTIAAKLLRGFGCRVLAHDVEPKEACRSLGVEYVELWELFSQSDLVTLHCPLTPQTRHMVSAESIEQMKRGAMLINTSRGALVDTRAMIAGLKSGRLGSVALDVYEEEADYFFEDFSGGMILDDVLARLMTFPNVLITSHQAFFTREAMRNIAETTVGNLCGWDSGSLDPANRVVVADS
ncbi:MAG: 2-hydroxyacid dehydrogenase [Phycisphaeraceae bacterium]|nr:2-hydroxyacid dehydrogenase [Phycisphaeraceae bacterium]